MAKLRSRMLTPPFGWIFLEHGITLNGQSFDGTVDLIRRHRKSNNLLPGNPEQELTDFTCARWPGGCDKAASDAPYHQPSITEKASDFLGIYSRWSFTGFQTVHQDEANRRGDICLNCPANQKVATDVSKPGCCGRGKVMKVLDSVTKKMSAALTWPALKNKVTPADNGLHTCGVCLCPNKASIWVPLQIFQYDIGMREKFRASNPKCWKLDKR